MCLYFNCTLWQGQHQEHSVHITSYYIQYVVLYRMKNRVYSKYALLSKKKPVSF
jgi:hypothetical protein